MRTFKSDLISVTVAVCFLNFSAKPQKVMGLTQSDRSVSFTENKGQVHDQFGDPRTDVLFSGAAKNLVYHLTNKGFCYQLFKNVSNERTAETTQIIQRVDVEFKGANTPKAVTGSNALEGYTNFYYAHCPMGALNVKAYESVMYHNIYPSTDLKWYNNNGDLEYDFILAPGANVNAIALQIRGAELSVDKNGSLILRTELGTLEELAPMAFQNGRSVPCSWKLNGTTVGFEVGDYDHAKELIIDPITRVWATYYGGVGGDLVFGITSDSNNNVYATGQTGTNSTPTLIATTGAHQTTKAGLSDAFLVKFNSAGVRQWGTYYGGASTTTTGRSCVVYNTTGEIYMAGTTAASVGISTVGSHQATAGGGTDGFLAKFNSSGVRIWATYYGGIGNEEGYCTTVDGSGNPFLSGNAQSNAAGVIATAGAHQTTYGGSVDGFLVKFNASGVRQWGTYYGGNLGDRADGCVASSSGDVYISGVTGSATGTVIASSGSHQTAIGGGTDCYLAKFNASGVRQWGTYYGGTGTEAGSRCATNSLGDVFFVGNTNSAATGIASAGAHQTTNGGGDDAFVVKFNASGVRQWGTYYGGTANDFGYSIGSNVNGDVFLGGTTSSSSGISTAGAFQTVFGGGTDDAFMVMFNSAGVRQYGTYYGNTGSDRGWAGTGGNNGAFYLGGDCTSANGIASVGAHQTSLGGSNDGFVVKFVDCATVGLASDGQTNVLCNGNSTGSASVTATGGSGFTYTWSPTGGNSAVASGISAGTYTCTTQNNCGNTASVSITITQPPAITVNISANNTIACTGISSTLSSSASGGVGTLTYSWVSGPTNSVYVVNPLAAASIYTITVTDANACVKTNTIFISRNTTPTISVNSGSICLGNSFTINPSGASTYTIQGGNSVVSPTVNTNYTVVGTSAAGCVSSNTATSAVSLISAPLPTITANGGTICAGQSFTIFAAGAASYTIQGGNAVVSPTTTSSYTIVGTNTAGCTSANTATCTINVLTLPTVIANTSSTLICIGQSATLTSAGALNYTWMPLGTGSNIVVTPSITTSYTVLGMDVNGCENSAVITQSVDACTKINSSSMDDASIQVYPNPTSGQLFIKLNGQHRITITNVQGQLMHEGELFGGENSLKLDAWPGGVYFIRITEGNTILVRKLIRQ